MKFAFISTMDGVPWGGSEELWSQSAARLKIAGHDIRASVKFWPQLSEKVVAVGAKGITLYTHSCPPPRRSRFQRILGRFFSHLHPSDYAWLREFNPDLAIISQGYNADGFGWASACREAGIPYVIIVHCNSEIWWFQHRLDQALASYKGAQVVFCVSQKNLDLLRLQLGESLPDAEIVWNPCNVSPEGPLPWPEGLGPLRLACVGRINPAQKGQDLLLQILAQPEWQARPIELNLYGTGADEQALRRTAEMLHVKQVHFRGHVSDVKAIWERNHLLVLPSRCEGLPIALVEAMQCGRPAVVTDIGGNAELCVDNHTGFVAPAPTVSLVGEALQRAWDRRNDWCRMGLAARARVEDLVPKDPVEIFCERLKTCVLEGPRQQPGSAAPQTATNMVIKKGY
jgi:glycosyltransferase involved in cell wall biosynthesis